MFSIVISFQVALALAAILEATSDDLLIGLRDVLLGSPFSKRDTGIGIRGVISPEEIVAFKAIPR